MKTSELQGAALDWAVVKCECDIPAAFKSTPALLNGSVRVFRGDISSYSEPVSPSTNWAHGGPIIEREEICVLAPVRGLWRGRKEGRTQYGPTPLIAAMRCYVASKLSDEVEIPEELK
jgi:hypothetical protein